VGGSPPSYSSVSSWIDKYTLAKKNENCILWLKISLLYFFSNIKSYFFFITWDSILGFLWIEKSSILSDKLLMYFRYIARTYSHTLIAYSTRSNLKGAMPLQWILDDYPPTIQSHATVKRRQQMIAYIFKVNYSQL